MSVDYFHAPSEVKEIVKKIRHKYYPKFHKAKIIILMRTGKWNKLGTISRVSKKQRQAGIDADYILTLSGLAWDDLSKKQKQALVDHELCHMVRLKKKSGTQWKLRHHEVEEFKDIVKRYGLWQNSLVEMFNTMKESK